MLADNSTERTPLTDLWSLQYSLLLVHVNEICSNTFKLFQNVLIYFLNLFYPIASEKSQLHPISGRNFSLQKVRFKNSCAAKGMHTTFLGRLTTEHTGNVLISLTTVQRNALTRLHSSAWVTQRPNKSGITTSPEVWKSMEPVFRGDQADPNGSSNMTNVPPAAGLTNPHFPLGWKAEQRRIHISTFKVRAQTHRSICWPSNLAPSYRRQLLYYFWCLIST